VFGHIWIECPLTCGPGRKVLHPVNRRLSCPVPRLSPSCLFCGSRSFGCPELFVDRAAEPERRIVITDDFGQRIQRSVEQLQVIIAEAASGRLADVVGAELVGTASA